MKRVGLLALALLIVGVLVFEGISKYRKYLYPYGRVWGGVSLPGLFGSLLAYAGDHDGWFPRSNKGPYDALQQLYPYCPSGRELAGVSGNADAVSNALRNGKSLDASLTSWVYVPGFRRDDPEDLAMVWESKPGLYWNGKRNNFGGRAVLLVGGNITNVPAADWAGFLKQQEEMRKAVQSGRTAPTNTPPQTAH
jgi:hypothetical protein